MYMTTKKLIQKGTNLKKKDIIKEFRLGHIVDINFQVFKGYMADVPRQANQRLWIALERFITRTGRFKADRQYLFLL